MRTVADLMITNLITLRENDSLATAKTLMQEKNIRNIPIVNDEGECVGMLTQREYLRHAFHLVSQFGTQQISKKEQQTPIANAMNKDILTISPETDLNLAAEFFYRKQIWLLTCYSEQQACGHSYPCGLRQACS